ncbi:hypothetical protein KRMM14A1259_06040 [Krasilnikovia sp. MM14-A1259]
MVSRTAARLDDLQRRITGDLAGLRASEKLNHHRIEGGVASCMRAAGHPYRAVPFVDYYRDFTDADLGYGIGHATVFDAVTDGGRRVVLNELAFARLERAGVLEPTVAPADVPALNACRARVHYRSYFDVEPPPGAYQLAGFEDLLDPVAADPAVVAAMSPYRDCMKQKYGYDVPDRDDFLFAPRLNRADAPADGAPAGRAWTREIAALNAALAADTDCRRPAYRQAMTLLAPRLAPWEAKHRAQLDAIRSVWKQRVRAAAKLGR